MTDHKLVTAVLVFALSIAHSMASEGAASQSWSAAEEAKLTSGEVIVSVKPDAGGASGQIEAALDIHASPARVWSVMLDCDRSQRFLAGLEVCRVVQESPDKSWDIREHQVRWLWFLPATRSVFRSDYTPVREIRFRRVDGDLKHLEGKWRLDPINNGKSTRLYYSARVDPGLSVPNAVIRAALEVDLPKTLKALREEVTGGGR